MNGKYRAAVTGGILSAIVLGSGGCENKAQNGALIGAGGGALVGGILGNNVGRGGRTAEGALIGAGVGAVGGYIVGNEMDKKDAKEREAAAYQNRSARQSYDDGRSVSAPAPQPANAVRKQDVIGWTVRGVKDEVIIDRVQRSGTVFHLSAADENELRDAGVSEEVVRAMKDTGRRVMR